MKGRRLVCATCLIETTQDDHHTIKHEIKNPKTGVVAYTQMVCYDHGKTVQKRLIFADIARYLRSWEGRYHTLQDRSERHIEKLCKDNSDLRHKLLKSRNVRRWWEFWR